MTNNITYISFFGQVSYTDKETIPHYIPLNIGIWYNSQSYGCYAADYQYEPDGSLTVAEHYRFDGDSIFDDDGFVGYDSDVFETVIYRNCQRLSDAECPIQFTQDVPVEI